MFKFLKEVVSGSGTGLKDLPYNTGEPYASAWGSWLHFRGTSKDDGSPLPIFSLSGSKAQDGHLAAGRNGVKSLRTVRHPNILSFLHSTEIETVDAGSPKVTIYMVTEPVMPPLDKIKELSLEGTQRDEYYAWGLHQIAKAVSFLNNDCKLVHGNVCLASVVVTQTLDWKLHAFDVLSEFDGSNEASSGQMLFMAKLTDIMDALLKGVPPPPPRVGMGDLSVDTPSTAPVGVSSTPDFAEHPVPTSPTSTDVWGELENGLDEERENDKDGWDDLEPLEEIKPAPALAKIQAAQRRPVPQPDSQLKTRYWLFN
ncbi:hypothetical protein JHK87_028333 [Glycine soja]|nr:hypothetical protein JHK87_028333 [Glycine soja]